MEGAGEGRWGLPVEFRVRARAVVILPPCSEHDAGLCQCGEQRLVQELVAQTTIEALDEAILHWLARGNIVPFNLGLVRPAEDGVGRELGPVIADNHLRLATGGDELIQLTSHANPAQRGVRHERQAFARAVINDGQNAEAAAIRQLVRHEVE